MHIYFKFHNRKIHSHGNRTLDIDQYAVKSGLAYVNPGLKLLAGVFSLIFCLLSPNGITSVVIGILMIILIVGFGKVKLWEYWHLILTPFTFILLSAIVLLADIATSKMGMVSIPVFDHYLVITRENVFMTARVSIKAICSITCLYMISLSTPMYEIISVLRKCKLPEIVIELMFLIYRFIFVLLEVYSNMRTAANTRLGYVNLRRSYQSFFGICSNLFVISFCKASKNFDAMEARGYCGSLIFLETKKSVTRKHIVVSVAYFLIVILIWMIERTLR